MWDYLHDSTVAHQYDEALAGTPLLALDMQFVASRCPRPGRVIDLGCGTGRIAIPLARIGHDVTAVDLSEEMLRVAGEKAANAGVKVNRIRANIVDLDGLRDGAFDYAVCMFATLGMIGGTEARRQCINHVSRVLRPGGLLLMHGHNRWHHLRTAAGRRGWQKTSADRSAADRPPGTGRWRTTTAVPAGRCTSSAAVN